MKHRTTLDYAAAASIIRDAFSPIMIDGALVLPEVSVGMIEASATRSPCHAVHAKLVVDHRHRVRAHLAGADRMVGGLGVLPDPVEQFVVGLDVHARRDLVGGDALHGRCRHDAPGDAHRFQRHLAVELRAQEVEADRRRRVRPPSTDT